MRPLPHIKPIYYNSKIKSTCFFFDILEVDGSKGSYSFKGGKTILGKIFTYQKETGESLRNIMNLPYIYFVIGMLDCVTVDFDSKDSKKIKNKEAKTAEEEMAAFAAFMK